MSDAGVLARKLSSRRVGRSPLPDLDLIGETRFQQQNTHFTRKRRGIRRNQFHEVCSFRVHSQRHQSVSRRT